MQDTKDIERLYQVVKAAVMEVLAQFCSAGTGKNTFPLYTTKDASRIFKVHPSTVRDWVKLGELHPRYQALSGRACRMMFTEGDLINFMERNLPSPEDLSITSPFDPRTSKAKLVKKILMMNKLFPKRRQKNVNDPTRGRNNA